MIETETDYEAVAFARVQESWLYVSNVECDVFDLFLDVTVLVAHVFIVVVERFDLRIPRKQ